MAGAKVWAIFFSDLKALAIRIWALFLSMMGDQGRLFGVLGMCLI
jgi:hypothetical protein